MAITEFANRTAFITGGASGPGIANALVGLEGPVLEAGSHNRSAGGQHGQRR